MHLFLNSGSKCTGQPQHRYRAQGFGALCSHPSSSQERVL